MADLTDEQIKAGIAAANAMDSTFDYGDGSTATEREAACIDAFRRAAGLPEWETYRLEGIGMVRRRKPACGVPPCGCAARLAGRVDGDVHIEGCPRFVPPNTRGVEGRHG